MKLIKKLLKKIDFIKLLHMKISYYKIRKNHSKITNMESYLIKQYYEFYRVYPSLKSPTKYSEILLWQKLYFYDEKATILTDKYLCKEYINKNIDSTVSFPKNYFVFDNAKDMDVKQLPDQCVIKCNHNSGYVFKFERNNNKLTIVNLRDKTHQKYSFKTMKKILNLLLKINYYYWRQEWNYRDIKPKIIVEEYLNTSNLQEYKFYMNDGNLTYFHVVSNRQTDERNDFFDNNFNSIPVWSDVSPSDVVPELPSNIKNMISFASKLSKGTPALRVDLYNFENQIYFGEATYFHMGGLPYYVSPANFDEMIGEKFKLPNQDMHNGGLTNA